MSIFPLYSIYADSQKYLRIQKDIWHFSLTQLCPDSAESTLLPTVHNTVPVYLLKGTVSRDFLPFFCLKESNWALYE